MLSNESATSPSSGVWVSQREVGWLATDRGGRGLHVVIVAGRSYVDRRAPVSGALHVVWSTSASEHDDISTRRRGDVRSDKGRYDVTRLRIASHRLHRHQQLLQPRRSVPITDCTMSTSSQRRLASLSDETISYIDVRFLPPIHRFDSY